MAVTRQQLEQQLVAAHRTKNVQAAQQAAYAIRAYDQNVLSAQVPSINAPPPIDRVPKPTFGSYIEDISRGMGRGFVTQLEGMQQLVTHPYDTGKALIQAGIEAVRNPSQAIGEALSGIKSQAQTAMSSPQGFGQVLGENLDFIPGPGGKCRPTTHGISEKPKKTRASKAENIERGLYHPIGEGKKLEKPISEMQFTQEVVRDLPQRQIISPERLQGATIVPATGDRTAAGRMLTEIEGVRLPTPVALEGGPDFMRTHLPYGAAWASDKGPITGLSKRVQEAASKGSGDVFMVYTPMSHVGGDFSTMMSDALLEQIKGGKITKKAKKEFDQEVRRFRDMYRHAEEVAGSELAEGPFQLLGPPGADGE